MLKKILSIIICAQFITAPVFALDTGYSGYDFSDEAQQRFEQSNQTIPVQNNDFSKRKTRREIKKHQEPIYSDNDRTNYTPPIEEVEIPAYYTPPIQNTLHGSVVAVPQGTSFYITFDSGISSVSMDKNDRLTARLTNDWSYNGTLLAPAGSIVYGTAVAAKSAGYAYGSGAMEISFNQILTPNGNMINISAEKIQMEAKSERAKNMGRDILIGTVSSLLIGAAFTALGGGDDWGRNMLIYGGIGAAGGGIRGAMQRGRDIEIPDGTTVEIILANPVNISPYN